MIKKVAIHSVPRSGSTWLGQIFNSHPNVTYRYQPLFSYAFKGRLTEHSSLDEISSFYADLKASNDEFLLQVNKESLSENYTQFLKEDNLDHVAYKEVRYHYILENLLCKDPNIKVIGLIRNPKGVINSWLRSPREFRADLGWDRKSQWRTGELKNEGRREEFYGFDKWKEVSTLFLSLRKHYPTNFYLIKYDDLLKNLYKEVKAVFLFCGLEMNSQTHLFLKKCKSRNDQDPYSVFKSRTKDNFWRNNLEKRIVDEISAELKNTELEEFILE